MRLPKILLFLFTQLLAVNVPPVSHPRLQDSKATVDSTYSRAVRLFSRGEYEKSRDLYSAMLLLDKNSVKARLGLAAIAFATRDWSGAVDECDDALTIDPGNLEAHYLLACADREKGRRRVWFLRWMDFGPARDNFDWVLSHDSLYKDALYQLALLQMYNGNAPEALALTRMQIRLKPDLREGPLDLFKIYRRFLVTEPDAAPKWLGEHATDHDRYFLAEWERRKGRLREAEESYRAMLGTSTSIPRQLPLISLAKVKAREGKDEEVEELVIQAIDAIAKPADADLVFETVKYLVTNEELLHYRSLDSVDGLKEYFRTFWMKRNPNPGAKPNARLAEHYRRLVRAETEFEYYGVRIAITGPDVGRILEFPESYYLNEEFNDKGLVYLRHGEPNRWDRSSELSKGETWIFYETDEYPEMVVDFAVGEHASANDWRLTPYPASMDVFHPRAWRHQWEVEFEAKETVTKALSTDRYEWSKSQKYIDVPVSIVCFRGRDNSTIVEFSYPLPFQELSKEIDDSIKTLQVHSDLSYLNDSWKLVAENHTARSYEGFRGTTTTMIELLTCIMPPDSYSVHWVGKPYHTNLTIDKKMRALVLDFSGTSLNMSDVDLAYEIGPAKPGSEFNKGSLFVVPNPIKKYATNRPLYLYFEVYNLNKDQKAKTSYTIEYELKCLNPKTSWFARLLGAGKKSSIAFRSAREGAEDWSPEHIALDVHELEPGGYELRVKVTDDVGKVSVSRSSRLEIYESE